MVNPKFTIENRIDLIQQSAEPSMSMVNKTLNHLFNKPLRESYVLNLTPTGAETLKSLAQKYSEKKFKDIKEKNVEVKQRLEVLRNVSYLVSILEALNSDEDDYENISEKLESMIEQNDVDLDQIFDRICEMVARKGKVYRSAAFYLTTVFAPICQAEQLLKLAETMDGDYENSEEDDDEFAPITSEELAQIQEDDQEEEEEDESDEEEDPEPNPQMVDALRQALGRYAATEDDKENEDVEMDDDELAAVDERLSNVMKCFTSKGKKLMVEEAKQYRGRVAEILSLSLQLVDINVLYTFLPEYFEILVAADESGRQEYISAIVVATSSLSHRSKNTKDISKSSFKLFKKLCETAEKMHNAQMKTALINLALLLHKNITDPIVQKSSTKYIVGEIEKYFKEETRSSKYTVLFEIVRRFYNPFISNIVLFFELFKNTSKSKKGEAANLVAAFNRKDVIVSNQKTFSSFAAEVLKHFNVEASKDDSILAAMKVFLAETALVRV